MKLPIPGLKDMFSDTIDTYLKQLSKKTVKNNPNMSYFNRRFQDYELLKLNIKQLGYYIARELYNKNISQKKITSPQLHILNSKPSTQADIDSDWSNFWCNEMHLSQIYHRKVWEFCYIAQALYNEAKLAKGNRGIGFGCGDEPLPSLFAKYGAEILGTDLPHDNKNAKGWSETHQHANSITVLRKPHICSDETLLSNINFRAINMNDIPRDLYNQFDFCWSACALEHLGTIQKGLSFIENSLNTLKSGGIAVHTTELTLNDEETIDNWPTVLFQKEHFKKLSRHLENQGYKVAELDFNFGDDLLDGFIDIPPWNSDIIFSNNFAHMKLSIDGFVCTSFGIIIKKP